MTEVKFPQDYTEDEWVAMNPHNPNNGLLTTGQQELTLRLDHRRRTAGIGGLLYEAGKAIKACVDKKGQLQGTVEHFNDAVNGALAMIAIELDQSLPDARFHVMEYVYAGLNSDNTLSEASRPHPNITRQYWDQVNG